MATRKSAAEQEQMTDINIAKAISMLEPPEGADYKAWTKKEACGFLGMAYNTVRLAKIIDDFRVKMERNAARRAEKRGTAITPEEIVYIISEYINGATIDAISKMSYRSPQSVKSVLLQNAVPIRGVGNTYFSPELIPDGAVRNRFTTPEIVYSARYDSLARVDKEDTHPHHGFIYRIYLLADKWRQSAWQPAEELASLEHLRKLGVKL